MRVRIWRAHPLLWKWHCTVCGKTWKNRQIVALRRPIHPTKYRPSWVNEVRVPGAWERCVLSAHTHIKKIHGARLIDDTSVEDVMDSYYVAHVVIERVDIDTVDKRVNGVLGASSGTEKSTKRVVTRLAQFSSRSNELPRLLDALGKHLELVDEISVMDGAEHKGGTR